MTQEEEITFHIDQIKKEEAARIAPILQQWLDHETKEGRTVCKTDFVVESVDDWYGDAIEMGARLILERLGLS